MSLIAGIMSRNGQPPPPVVCSYLEQSISRNTTDKVRAFRDQRSYFVKVDFGTFGDPGFVHEASGSLSLVAGEPLLGESDRSLGSNRLNDLRTTHQQLEDGRWEALSQANGTFNIVHYQPRAPALTLIADRVGVRPLYFWADDDWVIFASALRILEGCPLVIRRVDLRAVTELVVLGTPLGDRTPYADISVLQSAEVVRVGDKTISRNRYWRWDEVEEAAAPETTRLTAVYDAFQNAISRRNGTNKTAAAFLSGGLDSRCVVAVLRHHGVQVHSVNFARPETQDYVFGNDFAERIGSIHQSLPKEASDEVPDYSAMMARVLGTGIYGDGQVERAQAVWSGEGGSVLLGCVHLNETTTELMRAGDLGGAIDSYLKSERAYIPVKLFRPRILEGVRDVLQQGIREELSALHAKDPARNFYLFLLLNDQRRKLAQHFENLDLHRLEFQLPFFDGSFLESVLATPLDLCLGHRFYVRWLSQFTPQVTAVPWQAYPEHEPCPVQLRSSDLGYQWDSKYQKQEGAPERRQSWRRAINLLRSGEFPNNILNARYLRLAALIHLAGWRDFDYAFGAAQTYCDYAKKCGGEFSL
jgi:asparagine synthase (glutamine-hydrolysing)